MKETDLPIYMSDKPDVGRPIYMSKQSGTPHVDPMDFFNDNLGVFGSSEYSESKLDQGLVDKEKAKIKAEIW